MKPPLKISPTQKVPLLDMKSLSKIRLVGLYPCQEYSLWLFFRQQTLRMNMGDKAFGIFWRDEQRLAPRELDDHQLLVTGNIHL